MIFDMGKNLHLYETEIQVYPIQPMDPEMIDLLRFARSCPGFSDVEREIVELLRVPPAMMELRVSGVARIMSPSR